MAASVYATPPPDHLSGDETALSDVSNSSQLSSPKSIKTLKRSLSAASLLSSSTTAATTNALPFATNLNITTLNANNGSAGMDANSISSVDSIPDFSKKRRKQTTPIRIAATIAASAPTALAPATTDTRDEDHEFQNATESNGDTDDPDEDGSDDKEGDEPPLPRIFLSDLSQLQQKNKLMAEFAQRDLLSTLKQEFESNRRSPNSVDEDNGKSSPVDKIRRSSESNTNIHETFLNNLSCDQCGLKVDSEVKLGFHILQEHAPKQFPDRSAEDDIPKMYVKKEPSGNGEWDNDDEKSSAVNGSMKPEEWLSLAGLPFPFTPEAAAMLSASGYLPQLPLLGVTGVTPFGATEGLNRGNGPPLRIFNPEAYCELCNKEFCNKYFLKTHKANKHNIYEPAASSTDTPSTSQLNHMTQVFQMQQQQIAQHQSAAGQVATLSNQNQSQTVPSQVTTSGNSNSSGSSAAAGPESSVFCDICFKRFTNVFAMRRHRTKTHEIPPPTGDAAPVKQEIKTFSGSSNPSTPITVPEGFREDFTIEQEDTTFTPQPRKLSPQSIQQAREANFSVEKLKRLGVVNPEAFCELCCKEYCNKYFLRTHKIKRHGIFMPPDDITGNKDDRIAATAAMASAVAWPFIQTSPLNLMLGSAEQLTQQFQNQKRHLDDPKRKLSTETTDGKQDEDKKSTNNGDNDENDTKSTDEPLQQEGDAISVDLQKLQSMILQLNDLNNQRPVTCSICGKEQENQFALHGHMITEHANLGDNNNGLKAGSPVTSPIIGASTNETCKHCDKELPNAFALSQHIFDVHGIQPTSPVREGFITPERPISGISLPPATPTQLGDRRPYTITPTSSYCEICNKELCNKYFMKTHMQRMHGIEIENGAQIGGVVCNICNKELCSKYFLRVHKHNTHGIIEEGSPLPQSRQNGEQPEPEATFPSKLDANLQAADLNDLSNRYFTHFTEVCPLCSRRFRGSKWLRTHLMADHGKAGTDKLREYEQQLANLPKPSSSPTLKIPNGAFSGINTLEANFMSKHPLSTVFGSTGEEVITPTSAKTKEYQCSFCPFATPSYAFLFIHERAHIPSNGSNGHIANNQSETAVSIAKDLHRVGQPSNLMSGGSSNGGHTISSSSETPMSTPATTPVPVPLSSQEAAVNKQQEKKVEKQQRSTSDVRPQEPQAILNEMANLTQRPTSYAIPQSIDGAMSMQSFLLEPINVDSSDEDEDHNITKSRFVPSVVFLPVRERITDKVVVSFTLTPA